MKTIKFRVWNGNEMISDIMAGVFGVFYVNPGDKKDGLDEKDSACISPLNTKYDNDIDVMQFTGMKDRNGLDIYEGDIIKGYTAIEDGGLKSEIYQVVFEDYSFCANIIGKGCDVLLDFFNGSETQIPQACCEVIGNIYKDVKLLNQ